MRVLFYAANYDDNRPLRVEQEITELQQACLDGNRRIDFIFLPAKPFETIGDTINRLKPDVVHISAHGTADNIALTNIYEDKVELTAEALKTLLTVHPPQLLYLNACNSLPIAQALTETVPFAIGTTADIANLYARQGAVNFYRAIMQGLSVKAAHEAARNTIRVLSHGKVDSDLAVNPRSDAARHCLYPHPDRVLLRR
jgi:CHAT domain